MVKLKQDTYHDYLCEFPLLTLSFGRLYPLLLHCEFCRIFVQKLACICVSCQIIVVLQLQHAGSSPLGTSLQETASLA